MKLVADKGKYFAEIKDFCVVPFSQTEAWYDSINLSKPDSILLLVDNLSRPLISCLAHKKCLGNVKMLLIEGICLRDYRIDSKIIKSFFSDLTCLGYDIIELNIAQSYDVEYEIGLRQAGYLRPVGSFSTQLSLLVPLQEEISYNRNWKRNLQKAHTSGLCFEPVPNPSEADIREFRLMYSGLQKDKGFRYNLTEESLKQLLDSSSFALARVKDGEGNTLSSIIYYKTGREAGGMYAAKEEEAKDKGATFYMYEQLFLHLKNQDFQMFDMAKLAPATHSKNNVFLFKNGIKGQYVTYLGEWAWYKNSFYRVIMYFVKKYLMKKMEV